MRFFYQACIILLTIVVFPLPSNELFTSPLSNVEVAPGDRALAIKDVAQQNTADISIEVSTSDTPSDKTPPDGPIQLRSVGAAEVEYVPVAMARNTVLVVGDSLSITLGQRLEEYFSKMDDIAFKRLGKVSSGLARPDFFDWEKNLTRLATEMKPSTVVIMIGTNDNKTLKRPDGTNVGFGRSGWDREYARRMKRLLDICYENNPEVEIFWVGAPIMGRPDLKRDVVAINTVIRDLCESMPNCYYVDTWDALADDNGHFALYFADNKGEKIRIRANDGVHLSRFGSKILAVRCLRFMADTSDHIEQTSSRPSS